MQRVDRAQEQRYISRLAIEAQSQALSQSQSQSQAISQSLSQAQSQALSQSQSQAISQSQSQSHAQSQSLSNTTRSDPSSSNPCSDLTLTELKRRKRLLRRELEGMTLTTTPTQVRYRQTVIKRTRYKYYRTLSYYYSLSYNHPLSYYLSLHNTFSILSSFFPFHSIIPSHTPPSHLTATPLPGRLGWGGRSGACEWRPRVDRLAR